MKVLITGGMGVNGAATARLLVTEGLRPVILDNRVDLSLIADIKKDVDLVEADVVDREALEKVIVGHGITHIAHLAALMPEPAEANPRLAMRDGVEGTVNVLELARTHKIRRVVYTSSKAVYGEILGKYGDPDFVPISEEHLRNPADLYGVIKVSCEELGNYYRDRYGVEFVSLRFSTIYGPGKESRHGALSFYGQLIERAIAGEEFVLSAGGEQVNDTVYVGDVARSILLALRAESPRRWVFNIGSGQRSTPREFAAVLKPLFPRARIDIGPGPSNLGRSKRSFCVFDISAAGEELGYAPIYDVERGVRDYVETIRRLRS